MKRTFKIIFGSIFILLFFILLNIFINIDNENFYTYFGFTEKYNNYNVSFNTALNNQEKKIILNKIKKLKNLNYSIVINEYIRENDNLKNINVYVNATDKNIKEMLPVKQKIINNFSSRDKYYSTSKEEDINKIALFSFYNDVIYSMYPFRVVEDNLDLLRYDFTVYYDKNLDENSVEIFLKDTFSEFDISISKMNAEKYDEINETKSSLFYFSAVAFIISALFILFNVSYRLKDISILKLNGYKNIDIVKYIFSKDILILSLLSLLLPIFLTIVIFKEFNYRIMIFLIVVICSSILIFIVFLISMFCATLLIDRYSLNDFLKNKNINNLLVNISFILLILSNIIVFPLIKNDYHELIDSVVAYTQLLKESVNLEKIYKINIVNDTNRQWEFDVFDFFGDKENKINDKIVKIYKELEDMNVLYRFNDVILFDSSGNLKSENNQKEFLAHEINKKYLDETIFYFCGNKINVKNEEDLNVFMDKETYYKNEWSKESFVNMDINTSIYLFDRVNYKRISDVRLDNFDNEKYPVFLYTNNEKIFVKEFTSNSVYIDGDFKEKVDRYLIKNSYNENIKLTKINDRINNYKQELLKVLKTKLISILPALLSILSILASFTNFYILTNKKEIKILKSLGYSKIIISKPFIIELFMTILLYLIYSFLILKSISFYTIILLTVINSFFAIFFIYSINNIQIKNL